MTVIKMNDENKANIIAKYNQNISIANIAKLYNVAYTTIYFRLVKWGVTIRKHGGVRIPKGKRPRKQYRRKFSPEFLARRAECQRLCGGKVKYVKFEGVTEDQKLIRNILCHPIIG